MSDSSAKSGENNPDLDTSVFASLLKRYAGGGVKILYKGPWEGGAWTAEDNMSLGDRDKDFETWAKIEANRHEIKSKGMEQYLDLGWQKMNAGQDQDLERSKPRTDKEKDQIWKELYQISFDPFPQDLWGHAGEGKILMLLGDNIDLTDKIWDKVKIKSKEGLNETAEFFVTTKSDVITMIAERNFQRHDTNRTTDKWLHNSDLVFRGLEYWIKRYPNQPEHEGKPHIKASQLNIVWRWAIINAVTRRAITLAHQATNRTLLCWGKFKADSNDETERTYFRRLIATENARATFFLLRDHREAFKSKEIREIWTFPPGSVPGLVEFHMILMLGSADQVAGGEGVKDRSS